MSDAVHITLGKGDWERTLPVYDQPWKRIVKRLGRVMDAVRGAVDPETGDFDGGKFVEGLGGRLYDTLTTFVPALPEFVPQWQFEGYVSPEAAREDRYDEDADPSPTFPQFVAAFEAIWVVNGGQKLTDYLGKVFDPKMLKAEASLALSEWRERSIGSQNSPGEIEGSPTSGSTPSGPTEEMSGSSSEDGAPDFVPGPWAPIAA